MIPSTAIGCHTPIALDILMTHPFQHLDPNDCHLQDTRIDIWQYPLHTERPEFKSWLNQDELTRANRYYFDRHRRRFIVARAMLRFILARYLSTPPHQLEFSYNSHGKPALSCTTDLQFNLSHSGELALLAIGKTHPLGIDLEHFSTRPYQGIAQHLFSPLEIQALAGVANHIKPMIFFHIWAQKEAFIKACGLGLAYPTQTFNVPTFPPSHHVILDQHHHSWNMRSFMPEVACGAALCHHPSITDIHYDSFTIDDIV